MITENAVSFRIPVSRSGTQNVTILFLDVSFNSECEHLLTQARPLTIKYGHKNHGMKSMMYNYDLPQKTKFKIFAFIFFDNKKQEDRLIDIRIFSFGLKLQTKYSNIYKWQKSKGRELASEKNVPKKSLANIHLNRTTNLREYLGGKSSQEFKKRNTQIRHI